MAKRKLQTCRRCSKRPVANGVRYPKIAEEMLCVTCGQEGAIFGKSGGQLIVDDPLGPQTHAPDCKGCGTGRAEPIALDLPDSTALAHALAAPSNGKTNGAAHPMTPAIAAAMNGASAETVLKIVGGEAMQRALKRNGEAPVRAMDRASTESVQRHGAGFTKLMRVLADRHLKIIHHDLYALGYQPKVGYDERREMLAALDEYFGADREHLKGTGVRG